MVLKEKEALHFALFPFMAQGHMIPMVDIGKLLAQHGVTVTIFTTPQNAARFEPVVQRAVQSGLPINIALLNFPDRKEGSQETNHENLDQLNSLGTSLEFFKKANSLEIPAEKLLEEMNPRPDCVIADVCLPYTNRLAERFRIPKIVFHGMCSFCLLCSHVSRKSRVFEGVETESEYVRIPDFPGNFEFTSAQVPMATHKFMTDSPTGWEEFLEEITKGDETSYGVIVNTFRELEPEYVERYKKERDGKVWCVGPVSLSNKVGLDRAERGNKASIDQNRCLEWLDSREPKSVLYVCMGSLCNLPLSQLVELGLGLEESNRPFIWVVRGRDKSGELEKWISESRFEERVRDRGLLIKGWAPQVVILSHSSVGGFLTHCGWNSTLEGLTAGLPLLTWPLFGDQFCNEKLVVQVLKAGVRVGVDKFMTWGDEDNIGVLIDKEGVKNAVEELMGGGEEGAARRARAAELAVTAKEAVEDGGSSSTDIALLIREISNVKTQDKL